MEVDAAPPSAAAVETAVAEAPAPAEAPAADVASASAAPEAGGHLVECVTYTARMLESVLAHEETAK